MSDDYSGDEDYYAHPSYADSYVQPPVGPRQARKQAKKAEKMMKRSRKVKKKKIKPLNQLQDDDRFGEKIIGI